MIWELYKLFGKDENFKVPVLVDSPLANRLLDCYSSILEGEAKEQFDEMMSWSNLRRIVSPEESKTAVADKSAKVILSSSGMISAGRSVKWLQNILPNENDCILFIGYADVDTLAWKIKTARIRRQLISVGSHMRINVQLLIYIHILLICSDRIY
ncbi:hypothetical protein [Eubacterium ramulus]|uniref:hypothetical protein n=1 Tax=Eubacterium ramulus TaxID=39490 RepID=UPI00399A567D